MAGAFVIGTGRSGTSLVMQALGALGVRLPDDAVPATENNLRGTGEAIVVRDRMSVLNRALGSITGFRPDGWRETPAAGETLAWLTDYLQEQEQEAGAAGFAIKFPLSAIFLPLWFDAADRAGVTLHPIWATRAPATTLASLRRTYDHSAEDAARIWAQRSYYLLRDAPDRTILLPAEGWSASPAAQIAAIADRIGTTDEAARDAATRVFSAKLSHPASGDDSVPETCIAAARDLEDALKGKRATLGRTLDRTSAGYLRMMVRLSDAVRTLSPVRPLTTDETEMRLALLRLLHDENSTETDEMRDEIDILSDRLREVGAANRKLAQEVEGSSQPGSDPGERVERSVAGTGTPTTNARDLRDELNRTKAALTETQKRHSEADARIGEAQEMARMAQEASEELRRAYRRLSEQRDAQEERIEARLRHRLDAAETQLAMARKRIDKLLRRNSKAEQTLAAGHAKGIGGGSAAKEIAQLRKREKMILSSTSWRITAPLRRAKKFFS